MRGLPRQAKGALEKARDSALLAVEIYNKPAVKFKSGGYITLMVTRFAILRAHGHTDRLPVALYVRNDNRAARLVKLVATCGAMDIDDPQPAITVMMPDED